MIAVNGRDGYELVYIKLLPTQGQAKINLQEFCQYLKKSVLNYSETFLKLTIMACGPNLLIPTLTTL